MQILLHLAIVIGWLRGGHPERFGALVLLLDHVATAFAGLWLPIGAVYADEAARDLVVMLAFGWLALRSDRWWPIAVTAVLALCVLVDVIGMVSPDLSRFAILSALLGFWILIYAIALAGVVERWMAGEAAVSDLRSWRPEPAS